MKVARVRPLQRFALEIEFEDGVVTIADLSSLAGKGVFAAWESPGAFEDVAVGSAGELIWRCGVDLCADSLYMKATGKKLSDVYRQEKAVATAESSACHGHDHA